jgi:hypothetical protein
MDGGRTERKRLLEKLMRKWILMNRGARDFDWIQFVYNAEYS